MKNKFNSICIFVVLLSLMLTACGYQADPVSISVTRPPEHNLLMIYTDLPEEVYLPVVREFENRTGIWVEVETGSTISKLEDISSGGENGADLLFGCQSDVIERYAEMFAPYRSANTAAIPRGYTSGDGLWHPFAISHLVVIYNSKLLREHQPNSWKGIMLSGWNKQVAYVSPQKSDVGYVSMRTVADALEISVEDVLPMLAPELEYDTCEKVLEAVANGKCYFGIVTEDVAVRAIADDSNIGVIYPKEGAFLYASAMAVFDSCTHEANAQRFIEFIQEEEVQEFIEENYAIHSIYKQLEPENVGTMLEDFVHDSLQEETEAAENTTDQSEEVRE